MVRTLLATAAGLLVVGAPLLYSSHRQTAHRNFRIVEDGVLYRSGQLSPAVFERVLDEYGIKTVVTLRTVRTPGAPYPDDWEKRVCEGRQLRHVRILPRVWGVDEKGEVPAEAAVKEFLAVMDDRANYPVLVHCFAGIHRTGTMVGVYRMEYSRWPAEEALDEMFACGYDPDAMHPHVRNYLTGYKPRWIK